MAASPNALDGDIQTRDKWSSVDDQGLDIMGPVTKLDHDISMDDLPAAGTTDDKALMTSNGEDASGNTKDDTARDRPPKPNKVYIGGLPEHTRQDDLRNCFGKLGKIVNIELKTGYGFVEFDNRESAEESVAKYHEGYFMGNKKYGRSGATSHSPLIDRIHPRDSRDYPPPRDYPPYRDDSGRYPPRESRYDDYPPPPPRQYRRPLTPPRDNRDDPMPPPRSSRDHDEYKTRGAPPAPPSSSRYDRHGPSNDRDSYTSKYPSSRDHHDRHDRRAPSDDRYPTTYPPYGGRPRTPPGPPPSRREDYDRHRGHEPPPERMERERPMTPPRPVDYPRDRSAETARYRRRSLSPPSRNTQYESSGHTHSGYYSGNRYASDKYSAPSRDSGRSRDYHRNGRDSESGNYRRV
ncbi:hypothetical protein ID866_6280 [Astraeus odoratus]|nr:hypothetical protein ID866_6280 [Astraeus odoratus]